MDSDRYPIARVPTDAEWAIRARFLELGRSVPKTAYALGLERPQVLRAVMACRWYLQDSGYDARYREARSLGFGESDARLHADQVAELYRRKNDAEG